MIVAGGTGVLRGVCLHDLLEKHRHGTSQEAGLCVCQHVSQVVRQWYSWLVIWRVYTTYSDIIVVHTKHDLY
jgi:hypothetical protein